MVLVDGTFLVWAGRNSEKWHASRQGIVTPAMVAENDAEDDLSTVELILELSTRSKQYGDRDLVDVLLQPVKRS